MPGIRPYVRFLLAYRREIPDGPGEAPTRRGWIVRVPEDTPPVLLPQAEARWFGSLAELPALVEALSEETALAAEPGRSASL